MNTPLSAAAVIFFAVHILPAAESPQDVLARHGLREENGRWVLAEERRVKRLLVRFDDQLRKFYSTAKAWRQQIQQVDVLEKELKSYEERYAEIDRQRQRSGNLLTQQQLAQQQGAVSQRLGELRLKLKGLQNESESQLFEAAQAHANIRLELTATAAALRDAQRRLSERYEVVNGLTDVAEVVAELRAATGAEARLGSADFYLAQVEAATGRADKALAGLEFPLMSGGEHVRVGVLVDGRPTTFLIDDAKLQTLLPLAQAERLGLVTGAEDSDDDPTWESLQYGDEVLRVRWATLKALRVGDVTLLDVAVLITDRGHADLGPRIGSELIDLLDLRIERGRATIKVGRPSPAERNAAD